MDKERRQVKDSVHNAKKVIWANNDVLWVNKFISYFPDNDKQDSKRSD